MIFNSLRWRLQLWHGLILFSVLAGFGFTAHQLQRANEQRRVDQELQQRLGVVLEAFGRPPPGGSRRPGGPENRADDDDPGRHRPAPREFRLGPNRVGLFEGGTNGFYYVIWRRDGLELFRSDSAPPGVQWPEAPAR